MKPTHEQAMEAVAAWLDSGDKYVESLKEIAGRPPVHPELVDAIPDNWDAVQRGDLRPAVLAFLRKQGVVHLVRTVRKNGDVGLPLWQGRRGNRLFIQWVPIERLSPWVIKVPSGQKIHE